MTTQRVRGGTLVALLAVALAAGTTGALASGDSRGNYASPELIQLGHGPGGPVASVSPLAETDGVRPAYASPELIQLGHGPGGPPAVRRS